MRWIVVVAMLVLASQAGAVGMASCAKIADDGERLTCYDDVAGRIAPDDRKTSIEKPSGDTGKWFTNKSRSKFKDTYDVTLTLISEESPDCRWGNSPAILQVRCLENTTSVVLSTPDCHLTSGYGSYGDVDVRIDGGKARVWRMQEATNNRALGLWTGRSAIPRVKNMLKSRQVIMRFTPHSENPRTVEFQTSGLQAAIKPLRESCGW